MAKNKISKNLVVGVGSRLLIIAMGIIMPRLIMVNLGSEANGLLSTVGQIYAYIALLEAGIGNATLNALYSPLANDDRLLASSIVSSSLKAFRKSAILYAGCVVALAIILPFVLSTTIDKTTIAIIVLLQGASNVANYVFAAAYKQLLIADGENYIIENTQLIVHVGTTLGKIIVICLGGDIIVLQLINVAIALLGVAIISVVVKKKYSWLKKSSECKPYTLQDRRGFVIHEVAGTIFSCTDLICISCFVGMASASVYAVYNLVYSSLNTLISTVVSGTSYILGKTYHKCQSLFVAIYDTYDRFYCCLVFSIMTVACALTLPFVGLYTSGVTDVDYIDQYLPYLFAAVAVLSASRAAASKAITVAGHVEQTKNRAIIEAGINLVASIVLVNIIGIYGVLIGTIVALLYRVVDMNIYVNRKILQRSCVKSFLFIGCSFVLSYVEIELLKHQAAYVDDYIKFILAGIVGLLLISAINFVLTALLNLKNIIIIKKSLNMLTGN